ncbi:MAG: LacI family DNA-binding transcriptional regulator [Kiritimatiellae bacterium]|jgi:DNA-binding LacI/PurR family transcriptional regulator|nr:LacI family DNA-binding transcriptional regulator [Kiritimatiellia bacterium]
MKKSKKSIKVGQKVTMSDIARYCGVSRQVISAILLPDEKSNVRFSQQTFNTVVAAAEKYNFRPNRTARSLLKNNHGSFGVLVQTLGNIPSPVLHRMLSRAKKYDKVLIMDHLGDDFDELPIIIKEDTVDGIVVFEDIPEEFQLEIERHNIPYVPVNNSDVNSPRAITFDEKQGMRLLISHLVDRGRKNLLFIGYKPTSDEHYSVKARRIGFEKATAALGVQADVVLVDGVDCYDEIFDFIKNHQEIDGIVMYVDSIVSLVYKAAKNLGKRIPEDIAVVGVNNSSMCAYMNPSLTSICIDNFTLGETVIDKLYEYVSDENAERSTVSMEYILHERESSQ